MKKNPYFKKVRSLMIISYDKHLINRIYQAILLIKKTDKIEYQKLFSRFKMIFITNRFGFTNEFFMPERVWFANKSVVIKNDLSWLASLLIHEAYHASQFKNGDYALPLKKLEPSAVKAQKNFLRKLGEDGKDVVNALKDGYWENMAGDKVSFSYFRNLLNVLENKKMKLIRSNL